MSLSDLAGQDRARAAVAAWLESGSVPHAILICGDEGTGKRCFALDLAKALLCPEADPFSCDTCLTCRKVDRFSPPDIHVMFPVKVSGKRPKSERLLREEMEKMREEAKTHLDYGETEKSNIPVQHIRLLLRDIHFAPSELPRKIVFLFLSDKMHPAGANALLKSLEEPPPKVTFILISSFPERLLPTVLSRCRRLTLGALSADELRRALSADGTSGERLELAVRMGAGSFERAREVAAGGYDETRRLVEEFLVGGAERQDEVYWLTLDELGGDRGQIERFLYVCGLYLRDLFLLAHGQEGSVVLVDRRAWLDPALEIIDASRAALEIDRAAETLAHNTSPQLVLTDLWRSLRRRGTAFAAPPEARLVGRR